MPLHPDHHLMLRSNRWYLPLMLRMLDGRVKRSTRTGSVERARAIRDRIIERIRAADGYAVRFGAQQR